MKKIIPVLFLLPLLLFCSSSWATNTHGLGSNVREQMARDGEAHGAYVSSGCLPVVPSSSLTIASFPCKAYVKDTSTNELIYVSETAAITVPDSATICIGITKDTATAVSGWTRTIATHYMYQAAACTSIAAASGVLEILQITVAGSVITDIADLRPTSPIDNAYVNVLDPAFGVVADGTTDDLAALQVAENNAFDRGKSLWFPGGKSYAFDGRMGTRVSIQSDGAIFVPLESSDVNWGNTVSNSHSSGTKSDDLVFRGFTVSAGSVVAGVYLDSCDRCVVEDVTVNNAISGGIRVFTSNDVMIRRNHINNVDYAATATTGADGIYFASALRPTAEHNVIHDFERIGIVCEQDSANSEDCKALYNTIYNGHDSDDTATEHNACIWYENTNGGQMIGNHCTDMSGNAGQTTQIPYGLVIAAGDDAESRFVLSDNHIDFGDGVVSSNGFPITISGTSNQNSVIVRGGYVAYAGFGVVIGAGNGNVTVDSVHFDNLTYSATTSGAVTLDSAEPANVLIEGIRLTNITKTNGDAQDINIADGGATTLEIRNVNAGLVNHGAASETGVLRISDSTIEFGNTSNDGTFDATSVFVTNTTIAPTSGRTDTVFNLGSGAINALFSNCTFNGGILVIGGSSAITARFTNSRFINGAYMTVDTTGNVATRLFFDNNIIDEYDATNGFLKMNFTSNSADELYVRNNDFTRSTDVTPLIQWNEGPNVVEIIGNTYNSTLIENFDAGGTLDNVTGNSAY